MYKIGSSIISSKSISKVGTTLNLSPYSQSFRFSIISSLGSVYPPVNYNGSGNSNFQNNFGSSPQFNHLNGSEYLSGNRNGFHDFHHENFDFSNQFENSWNNSETLQQNFNKYHGNNHYNMGSVEGSRIGGQFKHVNNLPNLGGDSNGFMKESNDTTYDPRNYHKGSRIGKPFDHFSSNIYPNSNHIGPNMENYSDGFSTKNAISVGDANSVYREHVNSWNVFVNGRNNYMHPNPHNMHNGKGFRMDGQLNCFNRYDMYPNSNHIGSVMGRYSNGFQRSNTIHGVDNFRGWRGDADSFYKESCDMPREYVNDWRSYENMQQTFNQYHGNYHDNRGSQFNCFNNCQYLRGGSNVFEMEPNNNAYASRNMMNMPKYANQYQGNDQVSNFRGEGPLNGYRNLRDGGNRGYQGRFSQNLEYNGPNRGLYSLQQGAYQRYRQACNLGVAKTFQREESRFSCDYNQMNDFQGVSYNQRMASQNTDANGYYSQDQFGKLSTSLQQNSNGCIQQFHPNGFHGGNTYGHKSIVNNAVSGDGFSVAEMLNTSNRPQKNNQYIDKKLVVDDGYPCDRQSGFFGESDIILNQQPVKYYNPSLEQTGQYLNNYSFSETKDIISYEECVYKLHVFCEDGKVKEAVATLCVLEKLGMDIDILSYLKLVQVCGKAKSLDSAKTVHDHLSCSLDDIQVSVYNEILDMYSKCGLMTDANKLFHEMLEKNNATWEAMLRGLANNGLGEEAIGLFNEFKKTDLKPDGSLFNALFYACGVLSAVDQGLLYFKSMKVDYGISPVMGNYASIVDMLGRSGHLDEAFEFIESMPIDPSVDIWSTLMNYCRINGYIELRNRCSEIMEGYDCSKLTDEARVGLVDSKSLEVLKENGTMPDKDFEYHNHRAYEYVAGRTNDHAMDERIRCLAQHMKEAGHVPDITCTLHDIDPENREEGLMFHSERMALIHALMTSPARREIRIIKNLRVCRDCHNAMKTASKLTGRLIIARDAKRFHHFKDGKCSCNDFW